MNKHKFLLGNPCGACEWHIESDVRTYAWFDFIFQMIFVVPVILQLRINIQLESEIKHASSISTTTANTVTLSSTSTSVTATATESGTTNPSLTTAGPTEENECDDSKIHLAVLYSTLDVVNLSLGMITDIILYAGAKQHKTKVAQATTWVFLLCAIFREILHATGLILHVLRCSPSTYAYEMVVRLLCQYMVYGIWIATEYLYWLMKGRQFVPQRGQMEPPPDMLDEKETDTTITTSTSDFTGTPSIEITPPPDSGSEPLKQEPPKPESEKEQKEPEPAVEGLEENKLPKKKKKKKSKKKLKIDDNPPENSDEPGKGGSKQNI